MKRKYLSSQIIAAAKISDARFKDFMSGLESETDNTTLHRYIDALLTRIYLMHQEGKYMTKSQACKMIPATNAATCIKYVDLAHKNSFIKYKTDEKDKRKIFILPSAELLDYVEDKMSDAIDEVRELFGDVASSGLPNDNLRFSGMRVVDEDVFISEKISKA